nr:glutathione S-transferase T3-like [Ipomoea batatas]
MQFTQFSPFSTQSENEVTITPPSSNSENRRQVWSIEDDKMLARAHSTISQDGKVGNEQKGLTFWKRIEKYYKDNHPNGGPKRTQQKNRSADLNPYEHGHQVPRKRPQRAAVGGGGDGDAETGSPLECKMVQACTRTTGFEAKSELDFAGSNVERSCVQVLGIAVSISAAVGREDCCGGAEASAAEASPGT